jgi:hypothetical protein
MPALVRTPIQHESEATRTPPPHIIPNTGFPDAGLQENATLPAEMH